VPFMVLLKSISGWHVVQQRRILVHEVVASSCRLYRMKITAYILCALLMLLAARLRVLHLLLFVKLHLHLLLVLPLHAHLVLKLLQQQLLLLL